MKKLILTLSVAAALSPACAGTLDDEAIDELEKVAAAAIESPAADFLAPTESSEADCLTAAKSSEAEFLAATEEEAAAADENKKKEMVIKLPDWLSNVKLSGYGLLRYNASAPKDNHSNSFSVRLARVSLSGRIANDWYWLMQLQANGNTSTLGNSPRMVDYYVEYQGIKELCVKVGQFKVPFTFENPMNPIDVGFMSYGQNVTAHAGFTDRKGSRASNGRDLGIQLQGDLFPDANGRAWVHYQVGVFNGQGINTSDVDQRKDVAGGAWIMPIEGLRVGAFGWVGSYARKGSWTDDDGTEHTNKVRSLPQRRYAFSAEYRKNGYTFRSEYTHCTGYGFATRYQDATESGDCTLSSAGDKSQGVYVQAIVPVVKRLSAKARWDWYQGGGVNKGQKTFYEIGFNFAFDKRLSLLAEYALVNDRTLSRHNYNQFDAQLAFRF